MERRIKLLEQSLKKAKDELNKTKRERTFYKKQSEKYQRQKNCLQLNVDNLKEKLKNEDIETLKRKNTYLRRKIMGLEKQLENYKDIEKIKGELWKIDDFDNLRKRYIEYVQTHK